MFCFNGMCYDIKNDDAKYTNHSNNPNSYVNELCQSIAMRDIEIGEEICENYRTYQHDLPNYKEQMTKIMKGTWDILANRWDKIV